MLHEKGEHGEAGGGEAQRRPQEYPRASEGDLARVEQRRVARHAAVGHQLVVHTQIVGVARIGDELQRWRAHEAHSHALLLLFSWQKARRLTANDYIIII